MQGQEGESVRGDSGGSCLANPTIICSPAVDALLKTNYSSKVPIPVKKFPEGTSPIGTPAESSHVASVRNSLQSQGLSGAASSLPMAKSDKGSIFLQLVKMEVMVCLI